MSALNPKQTVNSFELGVNMPPIWVPSEKVRVEGSPRIYIKTGGSGKRVLVAFCGDCGTALYSTSGETKGPLNLRTGAIKQRRELIPKMQGFCGSGMPLAESSLVHGTM